MITSGSNTGADTAATGSQAVTRAYDRYAACYDQLFGWVLQDGRRQLAECLASAGGQRIVEFGVGSGLMLPLYPRDAEVVGLDLSPRMLERARGVVQREGLANVHLQLVDAEHNIIAANSADHVVLPYVYSVTPAPLALLAEALRVCRPLGNVWILNHFSGQSGWWLLEWPLKPFNRWIGFRSDFSYQRYITDQHLDVLSVRKANLFGLSRLVQIRKPA